MRSPARRPQSVLGFVRPADGILDVAITDDGQDGPELLLIHQPRAVVDVRDERYRVEEPGALTGRAPREHTGTVGFGIVDELLHLVELALVLQRAELTLRVH